MKPTTAPTGPPSEKPRAAPTPPQAALPPPTTETSSSFSSRSLLLCVALSMGIPQQMLQTIKKLYWSRLTHATSVHYVDHHDCEGSVLDSNKNPPGGRRAG